MFSSVQHKFESALSYFRYGSEPLAKEVELPKKILEDQTLKQYQTRLQDYRVTHESHQKTKNIVGCSTSFWQKVAALGIGYFLSSINNHRSFPEQNSTFDSMPFLPTIDFTSFSLHSLEPWIVPLTLIAGLSTFPRLAQAQFFNTTFFKVFGGTGDDIGRALTVTLEGDLYVTGMTNSYGAGGNDLLLSKFSSNGTLLWANTLGGVGDDRGFALTVTSEGDLIVSGDTWSIGSGSGDVLLAKFLSNGTLLWTNVLGGSNYDRGNALISTSDKDFILTGETNSFGAGSYDVLLAKCTQNGTLLWANTIGSLNNEYGYDLKITLTGDLIIAGYTNSFGGSNDVLVAKFSGDGTLLWAKTLGGAGGDHGLALAATIEGDLILAGRTPSFGAGLNDMLLTKFASNGTFLWSQTLGGTSSDRGYALTTNSEGELIVAGDARSFGAGGYDVLLSKFSSNGTLLWANTFGGALDDFSFALKASLEGDLFVIGSTESFGLGPSDVLLAKLNAQGVIENCSAWESILPQVQSITPTIADVTQNMTVGTPSWTVQDAMSAMSVADISNLLNQTTVCYAQTAGNRTFTRTPQASHSSETPLPNSQNTLSSPSKTRISSVKTTDRSFLMSSLASHSSQSTLVETKSATSTDRITSSSTPSPNRESTIPSITVLVYEESYPIIVNGETVGTFYFTGGSGQLDSGNVNNLNIQLDGNVQDGETITLFTIPEGEEPLWEDIVLSDGTECIATEGAFTTSEEEHSYQLIFQYESSECSQYTLALKLSAIPVLGSGLL